MRVLVLDPTCLLQRSGASGGKASNIMGKGETQIELSGASTWINDLGERSPWSHLLMPLISPSVTAVQGSWGGLLPKEQLMRA